MKRVIRLGDPTSHGGTVVSASSSVIINGKPVARVGDSVTCPIPGHGVVTIVEGDSAWLDDGRPIALEGHKTSCGASLITTLPTLGRSSEGDGSGSAAGVAAARGAITPAPSDTVNNANKSAEPTGGSASSRTGLSDDIDKMVAKSPSLTKDLETLKKDGWKIVYGAPGKGSYVDESAVPPTITIDGGKKGDPVSATRSLAHEVGHATSLYKPDFSSKSAYVNGALSDEGAAMMNNIKVQREILANEGPDIGISGNAANHTGYNKAYDQFLKDGNAAKARNSIGNVFGNGEITSTTNQSYANYHGGWYDRTFPPKK